MPIWNPSNLPEHNRRFARAAARPEDYHRRAPCAKERDRIFRLERERVISDDWVVRCHGRFFQLEPESRHDAPARGQVVVGEWPEGRVDIEYRGHRVPWREIAAPAQARATQPKPVTQRAAPQVKRQWVPPADHPWREAARRAVERRALVGRLAATRASLALPSASP